MSSSQPTHLRVVPSGRAPLVAEHATPAAVVETRETREVREVREPRDAGAPEPTLEQLFAEHARYVGQVALRVLGRDDEVDDIVQEVFLCALRDYKKLRSPLAVRAWLKTITVRKSFRALRRRRLRHFFGLYEPGRALGQGFSPAVAGSFGTAAVAEPVARGCSPEDLALLSRVYRLLDELPVSERVAWTLRYVDGEQVDEVAALCGCSLATAKRRIAAAHAALERMLSDD